MNLNFSLFNKPEIILMAIAGLLLLFAGYKVKSIAFFILWFLIGFNRVVVLLPEIGKVLPDIANDPFWQNFLPLVGGLLLALLGFTVEKVCIGGAVFALVMVITAQYFGTEIQTILIGAVIGVVLAGAAVMLIKPAIIIATAIAGSYTITALILFFATGIDAAVMYFPILFGVAAIGSVAQFLSTKGE